MEKLTLFSQVNPPEMRGLVFIVFWMVLAYTPVHTQEIICPANPPVLPCNVLPAPIATGEPLLQDLCPNPVVQSSDVIVPGGCPNSFSIIRTWTVTDDCLNKLSCTQVIQVQDVAPPVFAAAVFPPNPVLLSMAGRTSTFSQINLAGSGSNVASVEPGSQVSLAFNRTTQYDPGGVCPGCITQHYIGIKGVFSECLFSYPGTGMNSGTHVFLFTAPSEPGIYYITGTATFWYFCYQEGVPTLPPGPDWAIAVLIVGQPGCPPAVSVECTGDVPSPEVTGIPVVSDPCALLPNPVYFDVVVSDPANCPEIQTITRTWSVTDFCGNTGICTQIISMLDTEPPVITCPVNVTVECSDPFDPSALGAATAVDNCSADLPVTYSDDLPSGPWPQVFDRTWVASDACGNLSTCLQRITLADTKPPEIKQHPGPLVISCGDGLVVDYWLSQNGGAVVADLCGPVTWAHDFTGTICGDSVVITFTATDKAGNFAQVTATVWEVEEENTAVRDPVSQNYKNLCLVCLPDGDNLYASPGTAIPFFGNVLMQERDALSYLNAHPGLEHLGGVPRGLTIAEETKPVPPPPPSTGTGRTTGHVAAKGTGRTIGHVAAKGTGRTTGHVVEKGTGRTTGHVVLLNSTDKMAKPNIPGPDPCACAVNSHTGNLFVEAPLLDIPTLGPGLAFALAYNSGKTTLQHGFGNGWTFNYNLLWERQGDAVIIRRGDGRQDIFTFADGVYKAPVGVFDTLIEVSSNQFVLRNKYGTAYHFENPGHRRVTKIAGRNANELQIAYQDSLPVALTDQYGRALQFAYQNGLLQTVTDANADPARTVRLEYDDHQNLRRITDPLGYARSYQYDINRNIIQVTDPGGNIAEVEYTDNNAVKVLRSAIATMTIEYDTAARETVLSQQVGDSIQVATYLFDTQDRAVSIKGNCCGFAAQYAYDDHNNITQITDANGNAYQYTYDTRGNMLSETAPLGYTQTFVYDPKFSQLTAWKDRNGNTVSVELDSRGNATAVHYPMGKTLVYSYNNDGRLAAYTDANGYTSNFTYDDYGYLRAAQRLNVKETYVYDPLGRLQLAISPNSDTTRFEVDARDRLLRQTDALGNTVTYRYDGNDNVVYQVNARGFATRNHYDAHNRLIRSEMPLHTVTLFAYDSKGNLTYRKDPNGNETRWGYNTHNLLVSETDALGNNQYWQYDANGNLIRKIDRQGRTTNYFLDALSRRTGTTNALGETTSFAYDANGNNIAITSPTGVPATFVYDALDRLVEAEFPFSKSQWQYDGADNVVRFADANGNVTLYNYDALDRLLAATDALGQTISYTNDANGNVVSITDKRGATTVLDYDPLNRLTHQVNALGGAITKTYDENGNRLSETNARGFTTHFQYDALDHLVSKQRPIGVEIYEYDKNGNLAAWADADDRITSHTYNALNRLVRVTNPDNTTVQSVFDAVGNVVAIVNENGETTTFTYDALHRKSAMTNAAGETTTYAYDQQGNLKTQTLPTGNTLRTVYDRQSRPIAQYDNLGMLTSRKYDAVGNMVAESNGLGNMEYTYFDALNRPVGVTDALGKSTSWKYDPNNNILQKTDRNGRASSYTFDLLNRKQTETDALGNTTQFVYDEEGNLASVTDAKGNTTTFVFDGNDRLTRETFADGTNKEYGYSNVGTRILRKDNKGDITIYTYDFRDRMTARTYPNGNLDAYSYDPAGRLQTATNAVAALRFTYDPIGRITSESLNDHTTAYAYDIPNRKRTVTYSGGKVVVETADARGRFETIYEDGLLIATWSFDFADRMVFRKYGNNTITTADYNANSWMATLTHEAPKFLPAKPAPFGGDYTPLLDFYYQYDAEGNRLSEEKRHAPDRSEWFAYDPLYRLIGFRRGSLVTGAFANEQSFDYDPLGNRNQFVQDGQTTTYTTNPMNEYTAISGQANPVYDANGNLTDNGTHTFQYDFENRLTSVDNGSAAVYEHDALGRRICKYTNTSTEHYYFDGTRLIEERGADDVLRATYTYGIWVDDILHSQGLGQDYYYHCNALGSVTAITDQFGAVLEQYEYDAYGKPAFLNAAGGPLPVSVVDNHILFTGRHWDTEMQLYYYRARYYDPEQGRFLQRDAAGYNQGLNLYEYAKGNPARFIDPSGYWSSVMTYEGKMYENKWLYDQGVTSTFVMEYKVMILYGCTDPDETTPWVATPYVEYNLKGHPDTRGVSILVVGVTESDEVKVDQTVTGATCPAGMRGSKLKVTGDIIWEHRWSAGFNPGFGPLSWDLGLSVGVNSIRGKVPYEFVVDCCKPEKKTCSGKCTSGVNSNKTAGKTAYQVCRPSASAIFIQKETMYNWMNGRTETPNPYQYSGVFQSMYSNW